ncbi:conserved hypothetical protein [Methanosalsum zhilinae DSM 4017]|uniref:Uncharacterized protein n=1 Tax=Methanosalsum zhilinae (strain DSM 4017 / NBRC 107636 / OCM 62 / WeN5) TaxID=679901 RepID=F7XQL2_METZD|nr:sarcinarray family MAST domain-containing protein [Methanosalsum zhilinae]AEH60515.1 conserved hypothetical protein [Methanosalsum zhilinae DSM 4017]
MKVNKICIFIVALTLLIFLCTPISSSSNKPGDIQVYYNGVHLPGDNVAEPTLKIGEPFNVRINFTVYGDYKIYVKLDDYGDNYFVVQDGPSPVGIYSDVILRSDECHAFEWTVYPTDKWAGGFIPLDFHYSMVERGNHVPVAHGAFTVAYPYISHEHYDEEPDINRSKIPSDKFNQNSLFRTALSLIRSLPDIIWINRGINVI